jgi:uncharacterized protein YejL (UPF0352 family)
MSDSIMQIVEALFQALPRKTNTKDELTALGMIVTGIICEVGPDGRALLVESFCSTLRKTVNSDLN